MAPRAAVRGVLPGEAGRLEVPKLHCRYCGKPVPKGRRNWCSQTCIDEHRLRNNPAVARAAVLKRDRGVCAACGRDTLELESKIGAWLACDWTVSADGGRGQIEHHFGELFARAQRRRAFATRLKVWAVNQPRVGADGIPRMPLRTLWEADHILPVVEGGGGAGLSNLRTLCRCCHRKATAELAARRAARKRAAKLSGF